MSRRGIAAGLILFATAACGDADATIGENELRALVDSLLPALEDLSGLEARESVQVATRTPAQVMAFVERRIAEDLPPEQLDGLRTAYALLGLIPDSVDLRSLLLELYAEQIVGYYDPDVRTLHVVEGVDRSTVRPVIAHELVHALQDQHTNLDSLIAPARGNDRQLAAQAAIEGHATLVMMAFQSGEFAGRRVRATDLPDPAGQLQSVLEAANTQFPVFRQAPRAVREVLLFPYIGGASFVRSVWEHGGGDPRPPLGPDLPQSTEQVLHPAERFLAGRDEPTELRFGDVPAGWSVLYENSLGEFESRLFLEEQLGAGTASAEGWDGDRFRVLRAEEGDHMLDWFIVFDDADAADRFAGLAADAADSLSRPAQSDRTSVDGMPAVHVRIADTAEHLTAVPAPVVSRRHTRTQSEGLPRPLPRPAPAATGVRGRG